MFTFFFENRTVYEIMWKYSVEWSRPQMTIWRMPFECWIPKATNTYSGCVILIAFSCTSVALTRLKLRCTDFASLVRHEDHNHTHRHVDRLMTRQSTKFRDLILLSLPLAGRDSSDGIATRYGLDGSGIEYQREEIFRTRPDRPWGPASYTIGTGPLSRG